jgi:predicted RNA binding protein YcfA (HicA-like mRNA interferase family)
VKSLSGRQFCRLLERHGWSLLRIQGSHHVYGKPGQRVRISVPVHGNPAPKRGLQQRMMKLAAVDRDDGAGA